MFLPDDWHLVLYASLNSITIKVSISHLECQALFSFHKPQRDRANTTGVFHEADYGARFRSHPNCGVSVMQVRTSNTNTCTEYPCQKDLRQSSSYSDRKHLDGVHDVSVCEDDLWHNGTHCAKAHARIRSVLLDIIHVYRRPQVADRNSITRSEPCYPAYQNRMTGFSGPAVSAALADLRLVLRHTTLLRSSK